MLVSHLAAEKVAVLVFVEYKKQRKIIEFAVLCLNTLSCQEDCNFIGVSSQKWKISCFRHEDSSSETPKSESIDDILSGELVKPEFNKPSTVQKDWASSFREVIFCFTDFFSLICGFGILISSGCHR